VRLAAAGEASATAMRRVAFLDGRLIGAFNLNTIARGLEPVGDANWWVSAEAAGRGLATEGLIAMVEHALADLPAGLGLWSVRAWITRDNAASVRVAAKAGFRRAGDERSYLQTGEQWVMHDLYERRAEPT
jgi:ribosomal-protein-alanine N-acetyltransferase